MPETAVATPPHVVSAAATDGRVRERRRARAADLREIDRRFQIRQSGREVSAFLGRNRFLLPLLREAQDEIAACFPEAMLALHLVRDPETSEPPHLSLEIITSLKPLDAFARMERLYDQWWLDAMLRAEGKMVVNVEFR